MIRRIPLLLAVLLFAGCAQLSTLMPGAPQTPAQIVYAGKASFAAAGDIAVAYASLPLCKPSAPPLCHDARILADISKAATAAQIALDEAEKAVRDPAASQGAIQLATLAARDAVDAFVKITATLRISQ